MAEDSRDSVLPSVLHPDGGEATIRTRPAVIGHLAAWNTDQTILALHEAGHAVVGFIEGLGPKGIDIASRFGGRTHYSVADDTTTQFRTARALRGEIATAFAGLLAEFEVLPDGGTAGNHHDVQTATDLARMLVDEGLLPGVPWVSVRAFRLGGDVSLLPPAATAAYFDAVATILAEERERASRLVADHIEAILTVASKVYQERRLSDRDLYEVFRGLGLEKRGDSAAATADGSARSTAP